MALLMTRFIALIVAGGSGTRMEQSLPKQYLELNKKTIIEHTVKAFEDHPLVTDICVVIAKDHEAIFNNIFDKRIKYCFGGDNRQSSVRLGLEYIQKLSPDYVLIHDAARPFIDPENIKHIIKELENHDGVILAEKLNDTIKEHNHGKVTRSLDRQVLCAAQTPQAFKYDIMFDLHSKYKNQLFTDDSSLFEKENLPIKIIFNQNINFKITTMKDLHIARFMMEQNEEN